MCDEGHTGSLVCPRQVKNSAALCINETILDVGFWSHDGKLCWGYLCGTLIYTYGVPNNRHSFPRKHVREVDKVPSSRCLCGLTGILFLPRYECLWRLSLIYN